MPHEDGYPPEPIPGSPEYLMVRDGVLERRSWLDHALRDQLHWPWIDDEDLAVLALSERHALWASRTGRLHLVDHQEMTYLEEIAVSDRRPGPLRDYFPNSDDPRWGTDLQQFCAAGPRVILQFGESTFMTVALADVLP
ncbi:MAG: hypothetical protein HC863_02285 [Myxococcales bacterium]|nr:hypothetical protein [Myxococcales bacterium]